MRNQDVVTLTKAGLASEVIIAKIRSAQCAFDVTTQGLVDLKSAGVDDSVIASMVAAGTEGGLAPRQGGTEPPARIFVLEGGSATGDRERIELLRAKANLVLKTGMFEWGYRVVLPGQEARVRVTNRRPSFLLELHDTRETPNDWVLTKLDSTDEGRGREIDSDDSRTVRTETVSPGVYRLTPKKDLKRGEYAFYEGTLSSGFVPSGTPWGGGSDLVVYDFGIE